MSVNNVLQNTIRFIHLYIVYGCFHTKTEGSSCCNRDHMVYETTSIYYSPLQKKSLLTSTVTQHFTKTQFIVEFSPDSMKVALKNYINMLTMLPC